MSHIVEVPAPVAAFVKAINSADTETFVSLFASDGLVDDWGTKYPGREGVRQWAGSDAIGAHAKMTLLTASTEGEATTVRFDWRSRVFNGESTGIFVVRGGQLHSFTIPPNR